MDIRPRWAGTVVAMQQLRDVSPFRGRRKAPPYQLPLAKWPKPLQRGWQAYTQQVSFRLRLRTITGNLGMFELYVGFLQHIEHRRLQAWEDLFAVEPLDTFVRWHAAYHGRRITELGAHIARRVLAIARLQELPQTEALKRYCRQLPQPEPIQDQRQLPTLAELDATGDQLLAHGRQPLRPWWHRTTSYPRMHHALKFERGLILKLMVRIPLRSRNIRELSRPKHLYQDQTNTWQLAFNSEDLKIARRHGKPNTFTPPWPPDLVHQLEEWLTIYRPLLPNHQTLPHVFLNRYGRPYQQSDLCKTIQYTVMLGTGKRFHPHDIRTIYVTEMAEHGVPVETVAYMLNDDPRTVHSKYLRLRGQNHYPKAQAMIQEILQKAHSAQVGSRELKA